MKLRWSAIIAAVALSACGGGSSLPNGSVVNSPGGPGQPPPKLVAVKVTVTVPLRSHGIGPNYVSVNTKSLAIQLSSVNGQGVGGVNPTTIDTVAHARGCSTEANALVCTATASGSPGDDVFAVTTFTQTNANGAVLSVGDVAAKVGSNSEVQIDNLLLSLNGIVASLKLSVAPKGAKRGKPASAAVSLAAFDASGAQIVGPSDYASPIALAIQGDNMHAFSLHAGGKSGSSLSIVKPTSGIALHYDGNPQALSITLSASVTGYGSVGGSAPFALHGKMPPPPVGTIYALNLGTKGGQAAVVTEYAGTAKGNASPERTLSLDAKLYARTIAVDSTGNLYVGYTDNSLGYNPGTGAPDAGNEIAVYAPGAAGNTPPTAVITADSTTNTALFPVFITFDPSGRIVTFGGTSVDGNTGDAVLTYAAGSSGPATPEYGFDFAPTLDYAASVPTGLAIDSSNNFYVNGGLHTILQTQYGTYVASAADIGNPQTVPARTIPWDSTTQLQPGSTTNVALDKSGEPFVGAWMKVGSGSNAPCQARVNVYAAGAGGGTTDVPPQRVLTLEGVVTKGACYSNPLVNYFPAIALYSSSLFAADDINDAIDAFTASAHGNVKPSVQIAGSATQLHAPVALALSAK
ncbi:MAG: hypothetical protein JO078_07170 [Candidatus Eremiobacteraeota bacterium]|nr:hypothetical protein [Candidatus Eremiobacteraeota bacterium]